LCLDIVFKAINEQLRSDFVPIQLPRLRLQIFNHLITELKSKLVDKRIIEHKQDKYTFEHVIEVERHCV
jgi:hypothetical protein